MTPKDIIVFLEDTPHWNTRLSYAGKLAHRWRAHLTCVFVVDGLELHLHSDYAIGDGITEMLKTFGDSMRTAEAEMRAAFDKIICDLNLQGTWRRFNHERDQRLMLYARYAGLAIIGGGARPNKAQTRLGLSGELIFASGRPVLLLPENWPVSRMPNSIVIAWNGSAEAARAVANAMPFLFEAARIDVVVVQQIGAHKIVDFDPGSELKAHLARSGLNAELHLLEGRETGKLILDFATSNSADLLVMGAYGRSKLSESVLGGTTRHLLRNSAIPIILSL